MEKSQANNAVRALSGVVAMVLASAAFAADVPKEGTYDFTACWGGKSNIIAFSKRHVAFTYDLSGATLSNPPGSMFDHHSFHCIGLGMVFDGKVKQTTLCEAVDPDGNKAFARFDDDGKHAKRTLLEGTGLYKHMVSSGITNSLGKFASVKRGTFQKCNHQTGTYKIKDGM